LIVVDSSAVLALILDEEDADWFADILVGSAETVMSVANLVEASIVLARRGEPADDLLDGTLSGLGIRAVDVTVEQGQLAREAYRRFGRGSGHLAKLNFGDCFAYALAKTLDAPLLFKGEDFAQTDVKAA
jgi:ribonuclease VapC